MREQIRRCISIRRNASSKHCIPKNNYIEHHIWFEVSNKNDLILINDKEIEKFNLVNKSKLKNKLEINYNLIPEFVKKEQNLI